MTDLRPRVQSTCFACGADNPRGLRIRFVREGPNVVEALWTPQIFWEGFRGVVHGGVISTVLDEAMSKAVVESGQQALTGELRVRFRAQVEAGQTYRIRGWTRVNRKRLIETEATLTAVEGQEMAHAWAKFVLLPQMER